MNGLNNKKVELRHLKAQRFAILDRVSIAAKNAIQKEEDRKIFEALIEASNIYVLTYYEVEEKD